MADISNVVVDGVTYTLNDADAETKISALNSKIIAQLADGIVDGAGNITAIFVVPAGHRYRVPVLIGGNNSNGQFLRLYQIDLANLTETLTEQTRYADMVAYGGNTITVLANKDGGDSSRLRIRVSQSAGYAHLFIMPMVACSLDSVV